MKRYFLLFLLFLIACHTLYPHSRFGYHQSPFTDTEQHLNIQTATLAPGETISVYLVKIRRIASYSSSNSRIADVNSFGTVEAKRPGTAIIYVSQDNNTYRCKITVSSKKNP